MSPVYYLMHRALEAMTHSGSTRLSTYGSERLRDFCYSVDVGEAFAGLALADRLNWDVYNVASDTPATVRDALNALVALCPGFEWQEVDGPDETDVVTLPSQVRAPLDLSRLREDVGFELRYDLAGGLEAYLAWLRSGWEHL